MNSEIVAPTIDGLTSGAATGNIWFTVGYCILVLGILYVFMVRPQRRRMAEYQKMLESLRVGNRVMAAGIYGTIKKIGDKSIELEIAPNVVIEVAKTAVAGVAE